MKRLERIRERVVERELIRQDWVHSDFLADNKTTETEFGRLGRHMLRQREERRRQIVDRLLELSINPRDDYL